MTLASALMEPARVVRRRSELVDRMATKAEFAALLSLQRPILIYAMGKTGTTSLTEALGAATGRPVVKAHSLNRRRLRRELATGREGERPRFLWRSEVASRLVGALPRDWDIVTTLREPIGRAASAYFYGVRTADQPESPSELATHARGVERVLRSIAFHDDWFRQELEPTTGVNVYARPFDPAVGFRTYVHGRYRVLLVRSEDLRRVGPHAVAEFFGLPAPLELPTLNAGDAHDPSSPYAQFVARWRFPRSLIEDVCLTPMVRRFYSDAERAALVERWSA